MSSACELKKPRLNQMTGTLSPFSPHYWFNSPVISHGSIVSHCKCSAMWPVVTRLSTSVLGFVASFGFVVLFGFATLCFAYVLGRERWSVCCLSLCGWGLGAMFVLLLPRVGWYLWLWHLNCVRRSFALFLGWSRRDWSLGKLICYRSCMLPYFPFFQAAHLSSGGSHQLSKCRCVDMQHWHLLLSSCLSWVRLSVFYIELHTIYNPVKK